MKTRRRGQAESGRIAGARLILVGVVLLVVAVVVAGIAIRVATARIRDQGLLDQSLQVPGIEDPATGAATGGSGFDDADDRAGETAEPDAER